MKKIKVNSLAENGTLFKIQKPNMQIDYMLGLVEFENCAIFEPSTHCLEGSWCWYPAAAFLLGAVPAKGR